MSHSWPAAWGMPRQGRGSPPVRRGRLPHPPDHWTGSRAHCLAPPDSDHGTCPVPAPPPLRTTGHVPCPVPGMDIMPFCPWLAAKNEHVPWTGKRAHTWPQRMSMCLGAGSMSTPGPLHGACPVKAILLAAKNEHVPWTGRTCPPVARGVGHVRWNKGGGTRASGTGAACLPFGHNSTARGARR